MAFNSPEFESWLRSQGYRYKSTDDAEYWQGLDPSGETMRRIDREQLNALNEQYGMSQPNLTRAQIDQYGLDPAEYYRKQGFFPNEWFNDPTERQRLDWIPDKYGSQYQDLSNVYAGFYPGGTREAGGYRITPGQQPLGPFEWNPPSTFLESLLTAAPFALAGYGLGAGAGLWGGATETAPLWGSLPGSTAELSAAAALEGTGALAGGLVPSAAIAAPLAGGGVPWLPEETGWPLDTTFPAGTPGLPPGTQLPAPVQEGPTTPGPGPGGSQPPIIPAGTSALARLLGVSDATAQLLGAGGVTLAGLLGSKAQADAYQDVFNQQAGIGAPFRNLLGASYGPDFNLMSQPGYGDALSRIADISARSYSAKFGNPAGSTTAQTGILNDVWQQGYMPALANYRGQLGQFGGLGLNTAGQASLMGAGTIGGGYESLGYGLSQLTKQPSPWDDLARKMVQDYALTIGGRRV